ncbi:hypothetical protein ElyMa_002809600 [Elysia marginata]|uniref:Uncharacterized protein n=1 Tax=Elysia marginata TaxID=1093978 RepID=A0AAV4HR86_9GAST|nr:hypothetical protein ElyMa_002809600 [Elysia marginata]
MFVMQSCWGEIEGWACRAATDVGDVTNVSVILSPVPQSEVIMVGVLDGLGRVDAADGNAALEPSDGEVSSLLRSWNRFLLPLCFDDVGSLAWLLDLTSDDSCLVFWSCYPNFLTWMELSKRFGTVTLIIVALL